MRCVYVCLPQDNDLTKVKEYGNYVFNCGMAPVIPHFYTLINNDSELCIKAKKSLLFMCQEMWVFGNRKDKEMKEEIRFAKALKIEIKYINEIGGNTND